MILTERDEIIIREVSRWRGCLGKQIKEIGGFNGIRATDRRLKKLVDEGFLTRKKYVYGLSGIYQVTKKAKRHFGLDTYLGTIRLDQAMHDMTVVDVYLFVKEKLKLSTTAFTTEKEIRHNQGFTTRNHVPDFLYEYKGQINCVEVELNQKSKERLENNIANNYVKYSRQIWVVPKSNKRVLVWLDEFSKKYPNIKIVDLEVIENGKSNKI